MITKLTIRNFKSIGEQSYDFTNFGLLVGPNNCGKSTVLQAIAIWQFCINEFHRSNRTGNSGVQVILPNFTTLPLPEFNLLWKDRTERSWPLTAEGKKKQQYILISIIVEWSDKDKESYSFEVQLRYTSKQTIYAIPFEGWKRFRELDKKGLFPVIAYVPPFSGLETTEEWRDDGPIKKQIGKAQPGSVLRNLLLRVCSPKSEKVSLSSPDDWNEIQRIVKQWFSVDLEPPEYKQGVDTQIICRYKQNREEFDIISGGSGFHQALTLLAFLYGYKPTTILLDEPDAHLHVKLQQEILDYFKQKSVEENVQFLIATHAEEFVRGVDISQVISLLSCEPKRIQSTTDILRAMAKVSITEVTQIKTNPFILYVEGESDERILRAWAQACNAGDVINQKVCFHSMGGGTKNDMNENSNEHFNAMKQIIPEVKRMVLFDYDGENSFHPEHDNPVLFEWKRRNIENYLLVPDAWLRAVAGGGIFALPAQTLIKNFFEKQNLTLPKGEQWNTLSIQVFKDVDGKKLLFDSSDSLFQKLRTNNPPVEIIRERVAMNMTVDEIHEDVFA
ncbi:MAG: AAA family ATPase, partial [Candidatus Desantisbacteria bacterium]